MAVEALSTPGTAAVAKFHKPQNPQPVQDPAVKQFHLDQAADAARRMDAVYAARQESASSTQDIVEKKLSHIGWLNDTIRNLPGDTSATDRQLWAEELVSEEEQVRQYQAEVGASSALESQREEFRASMVKLTGLSWEEISARPPGALYDRKS